MINKTVSVKIPAGVDTGSRLRLTGEGEAGMTGGPPGDLYVFIRVKPHDFFERNNTDVVCQIPISFIQAALGDEVEVPTLNGKRMLTVPKGTQPGDVFRFQGEGIPSLRYNKRGDQLIQVLIKTPTNLNKKQETLLREFAEHVRDRLLQDPEITQADLSGVRGYEISVEISQDTLRNYNLTLGAIAERIRRARSMPAVMLPHWSLPPIWTVQSYRSLRTRKS